MPLIYFSSLMHATSSIVYYFSSTRCRCQLRCRPFFCQLVNSWACHVENRASNSTLCACPLVGLWQSLLLFIMSCGSAACWASLSCGMWACFRSKSVTWCLQKLSTHSSLCSKHVTLVTEDLIKP